MGNSLTGSGYGCELPAMVRDWRAVWSAEAGTTDPLAPFGIATLAKGGSEGHSAGMANMRWSQTANYGAWNNHALPNTFGAQLYDLGEPWANVDDGNKRNAFGNGTSCCYVPPGKPKTLMKTVLFRFDPFFSSEYTHIYFGCFGCVGAVSFGTPR